MAIMASKWAGKCRQCRQGYAQGADIFWSKATGAICLACHQSAPKPLPSPSRPSYSPPKPSGCTPATVDTFASWQEFLDVAVKGRDPGRMSTTGGYGFSHTDSWEDALTLAKEGWTEIRPEVDALVEKMDAKIAPALQPAFTSYFDVSGGMVDVGRFLDGEPECMVETKLVEIAKPGRVIHILVNGSFNAGTEANAIKERGAAIVALVDTLEKLQHSTEIDVEISCREGLTTIIRVKNAGESVDIDSLMFAIAHPAALRRIYFAYLEGHKQYSYLARAGSYGKSSPLLMAEELGASVALDGKLNLDATKWIETQLSEFGLLREEAVS